MKENPLDRREILFLFWGGLLEATPLPAWGGDSGARPDDHAKVIAQRLSQKTGVSVDQLLAAHKSGKL